MSEIPTTIAVIPGRKGSKRIPGKNTKLLGGKPLIQYSIESALKSKMVGSVVVTTDDGEIVKIAERFQCQVMLRTAELSGDNAQMINVLLDVVHRLREKKVRPKFLVLLQPTSPFRRVGLIDDALKLMSDTQCAAVVSHVPVDYFHPNRMKRIVEDRIVSYCEPEIENVARCDLPQAYYRDGALYAMDIEKTLQTGTLFGDDVRSISNLGRDFINVDEPRDWERAERFCRTWNRDSA